MRRGSLFLVFLFRQVSSFISGSRVSMNLKTWNEFKSFHV